MPLTTPVAYIAFNRPEHTARSFARIRDQRPTELFVIADGPRTGHPTDAEHCREVREIVADVDWPCTVHRDFADSNMGCKMRVSSGLNWVFAKADRAIVLEDDCIPNDDFFAFCGDLLDRYGDDDRVAAITGDNFQDGISRGGGAYYFSKYNHVWGWATWRRSWCRYDGTIRFWPRWKESLHWAEIHPDPLERRYWEGVFDRVYREQIDSWAYPWTASTWYYDGLIATPNVNLVSNIGVGPDATHTNALVDKPGRATEPIGRLVRPRQVRQDEEADRYAFDHHFGGVALRQRRRPLGFIRWVVKGAARRLKRVVSALSLRPRDRRAGV